MNTLVDTTYGTLEGTGDSGVLAFKGIPFAAPPVGELRWMPPAAPSSWDGVRPAKEFSAACPQETLMVSAANLFAVAGPQDEDCLYLNVWTPGTDDAKRPVMVWVHGGGFNLGATSQPMYDGRRLAKHGDVVVVSVNYRVGPFGFLNLNDATNGAIPSSGNEGLLDIVAALEWVRDNIEAFGGDPQNVTAFGESAGGWATAALMAMPSAQGLFHRVICQSGVGHTALSLDTANGLARQFISDLGVDPHDVEALRGADTSRILEAAPSLTQSFLQADIAKSDRYLRHVVDGSVLPSHVIDAVENGTAAAIPLMVGTTRDEVTKVFVIPDFTMGEAPSTRVRRFLPPAIDADQLTPVYQQAKRARLGRWSDEDVAGAIASDIVRVPSTRLLDAQKAHQDATYSYVFTWSSPGGDAAAGSPHGIDIGFIFGTHTLDDDHANEWGSGPAADALSRAVQDAWVAFARSGDPSTITLGEWPAYGDARRTMLIGERTHVVDAPFEDERAAWDGYTNEDLSTPGFKA